MIKSLYVHDFCVFIRQHMRAKPAKPKPKMGRPATGNTKKSITITMDLKIEKLVRKQAYLEGRSLSSWVEWTIREKFAAVLGKAGEA